MSSKAFPGPAGHTPLEASGPLTLSTCTLAPSGGRRDEQDAGGGMKNGAEVPAVQDGRGLGASREAGRHGTDGVG